MKNETLNYMAIARLYIRCAKYAGTVRLAVSHSYFAIDSCFSALLMEDDCTTIHRHNEKLNEIKKRFPDIFATDNKLEKMWNSVNWDNLHEHRVNWNRSRYDSIDITPEVAKYQIQNAWSVFQSTISYFAKQEESDIEAITNKITKVERYGVDPEVKYSTINIPDSIRRAVQNISESNRDKGCHRLDDAINCCAGGYMSDDPIVQALMENDPCLRQFAEEIKQKFSALVDTIKERRTQVLQAVPNQDDDDVKQQSGHFMMGFSIAYQGVSQRNVVLDQMRPVDID